MVNEATLAIRLAKDTASHRQMDSLWFALKMTNYPELRTGERSPKPYPQLYCSYPQLYSTRKQQREGLAVSYIHLLVVRAMLKQELDLFHLPSSYSQKGREICQHEFSGATATVLLAVRRWSRKCRLDAFCYLLGATGRMYRINVHQQFQRGNLAPEAGATGQLRRQLRTTRVQGGIAELGRAMCKCEKWEKRLKICHCFDKLYYVRNLDVHIDEVARKFDN